MILFTPPLNFHRSNTLVAGISRTRRGMTFVVVGCLLSFPAHAALNIPITVNLSESVDVTGTPHIAVDVGGTTRYATYTSGTGTNALTFTLAPQAGDVDLDGVTVSSPIQLNGGTIKDTKGNNAALTFTPPSTTNVKVNYPSLGMDFVYDSDGRYTLNGTAYNDLTSFLSAAGGSFTRASTATYYDSTGTLQTAASGVPRFDYDPVTHAAKGILIEESRTNLLLRSSEFDNAAWTKNNDGTSANVVIAPDGTNTADKLVEDTSSGTSHTIFQIFTHTGSYTTSVYAKSGGRTKFELNGGGGVGIVRFDLQSGTFQVTSGGPNVSMMYLGNGWYRCSVSGTRDGSASQYQIILNDATNNRYYTGDGVSGIYIWGAQLEQGAFPTSYIPTTTAAVTRPADTLVIPTNSWYDQNNGTFYGSLSWESSTGSGYPMFIRADDLTNNNRWNLYLTQSSGSLGVDTTTLGTPQAYWSQSASSTAGSIRAAAAQAPNNANSAFNGSLKTLDTSYTPPAVTRFYLPTATANRWFKTVRYYPSRVTDTQLQLLTQ